MFINDAHKYSILQREQDIQNIINYFVDLDEDNIDINDPEIQRAVFSHYNFEPSELELETIEKGVKARIKCEI